MFNRINPFIIQSSPSFHRVQLPLTNGGFDFESIRHKTFKETCIESDILFFSRTSVEADGAKLAKEKLQVAVVNDVDDHWDLPADHINWPAAMRARQMLKDMAMMQYVDAISVSTRRLAEEVFHFNDNVWIIPNAIPFEGPGSEQFLPVERPDDKVMFGWVGGASHGKDIKLLQGVFRAFPQLPFTMCGYFNNKEATEKNVWDQMERVCSFNYNNPNYIRKRTLPLLQYMQHYDTIDVALAPLEDTKFNSFKSSLKIYEAGAKKCAVICSAVAPYTDEQGAPVTYCKTSSDWKEAVKKHKDKGYAVEMGNKLYEWVKTHRNMADMNKIRVEMFKSVTHG